MVDSREVYDWIASNFVGLVMMGVGGFAILNVFFASKKYKRLYKMIVLGAGIIYFAVLLYLTLGMRSPGQEHTCELALFWSYREVLSGRERWLLWENIANLFLFFPLGIFLYEWLGNKRKWYISLLLTISVSVGIELIQLITKLGLFEFDDILHNALGGLIGYIVAEKISEIDKKIVVTGEKRR